MALIGENAIDVEPVETDSIGSLATLMIAELPGVSDIMVRQQLGYALREFCRETDACVVTQRSPFFECRHVPLTMTPSGMDVLSVLDVASCGRSVRFSVCDEPVVSVRVEGWAVAGDWLEIRYSVAPKVGGEACPKWFKERYAEAITAGAMFHLLSMSGKGWSDPQRAAQYGGKYQEAIADAAWRRHCGSAADSGPASAVPSGGLFM